MLSFSTFINEDFQTNKKFVEEYYRMGTPNPIGKGVLFAAKDKGVVGTILVILQPKETYVYLQEMRMLDNFHKGFGTYFMQQLVNLADKRKVTLSLVPKPLPTQDGMKISKQDLITFYKKFNFKKDESNNLTREPK